LTKTKIFLLLFILAIVLEKDMIKFAASKLRVILCSHPYKF